MCFPLIDEWKFQKLSWCPLKLDDDNLIIIDKKFEVLEHCQVWNCRRILQSLLWTLDLMLRNQEGPILVYKTVVFCITCFIQHTCMKIKKKFAIPWRSCDHATITRNSLFLLVHVLQITCIEYTGLLSGEDNDREMKLSHLMYFYWSSINKHACNIYFLNGSSIKLAIFLFDFAGEMFIKKLK